MTIDVRDNPAAARYEAREGEELAGFAEYRVGDGRVVLHHTVVDDAFGGRGVGSALARAALDDVRARGLRVVADCSFMRSWIDKHPDYQDLLVR